MGRFMHCRFDSLRPLDDYVTTDVLFLKGVTVSSEKRIIVPTILFLRFFLMLSFMINNIVGIAWAILSRLQLITNARGLDVAEYSCHDSCRFANVFSLITYFGSLYCLLPLVTSQPFEYSKLRKNKSGI